MFAFIKSAIGFIPHLFTLRAIDAENKALKKEIDLLKSQKEKSEQEHADYKRQQSETQHIIQRENEMLREKLMHKIPSENEREASRLKVLSYDPFEHTTPGEMKGLKNDRANAYLPLRPRRPYKGCPP